MKVQWQVKTIMPGLPRLPPVATALLGWLIDL
jgi:hypothetical protein